MEGHGEEGFELDPAFAATSHAVLDLPLCHVRIQDDFRYPWFVLIPRKAGLVRDLDELDPGDRMWLMEETALACAAVRALGQIQHPVEKLNIGALGNITPQFHVHVVGRRAGDPAWPGPVWGHSPAEPYSEAWLRGALSVARFAFGERG